VAVRGIGQGHTRRDAGEEDEQGQENACPTQEESPSGAGGAQKGSGRTATAVDLRMSADRLGSGFPRMGQNVAGAS
jgi:hypothetical protein